MDRGKDIEWKRVKKDGKEKIDRNIQKRKKILTKIKVGSQKRKYR